VRQVVVSALGPDRSGIVAAVTKVLLEHRLNIADSHMGRLSGRFSMMVICDAPDDLADETFLKDLLHAAADCGLDVIFAHDVSDGAPAPEPTHVVTVYGADHPGIVHAVAAALAELGANILDLETRLAGDLYVMTLDVAAEGEIEDALKAAGAEQGVEVTVRPFEADVL
jgi:glycine cleavage system transcriptional repressor